MYIFDVGKPFPLRELPKEEGALVEITPETIVFVFLFDKPTRSEMKEFHEGKVQFRFLAEGDVLFFLAKIGRFEWMDAPYHQPLINVNHLMHYPKPTPARGYDVLMTMVDVSTMNIVGMRVKSLSYEQSITLPIILEAQRPVENYDRELVRIYEKYPLSEDMAVLSTF